MEELSATLDSLVDDLKGHLFSFLSLEEVCLYATRSSATPPSLALLFAVESRKAQ